MISFKLFLLVIFQLLILAKTEEINRQGKEYYNYFPPEEDKRFEYPGFQNPTGFIPYRDECLRNPLVPIMGKGMNLLLLKLGALGIMKALMGLVFLGLLAKLPLIALKLAFLKSLFLPIFVAPLLISLFTNQMNKPGGASMEEKPGTVPAENESMMEIGEMNVMDMGRQMTNNFSSAAWESVKMFAESDQCIERITCIIGASNKDSSMGKVFSRMLKFLHYSSSPALKERFSTIREAYNRGIATSSCTDEDYKCNNPELLIQQGATRVKIL